MTDEEIITIQIDQRTHRIPVVVFRRLLTSSRSNLQKLQKEEGRMFPQVDRAVLELITDLQFRHSALI